MGLQIPSEPGEVSLYLSTLPYSQSSVCLYLYPLSILAELYLLLPWNSLLLFGFSLFLFLACLHPGPIALTRASGSAAHSVMADARFLPSMSSYYCDSIFCFTSSIIVCSIVCKRFSMRELLDPVDWSNKVRNAGGVS